MVEGMARVNIAEAKARLSELIDAALQGEEVIIARRNIGLVQLTVVKPPSAAKPGRFKGRIRIAADFDAPLEDFAEHMPRAAGTKRTRRR